MGFSTDEVSAALTAFAPRTYTSDTLDTDCTHFQADEEAELRLKMSQTFHLAALRGWGEAGHRDLEWGLRAKLSAAYRIAAFVGWDELILNHITVKVPDTEASQDGPHFLVNPFGLRFDEVTASSLLKVSSSGVVIDAGSHAGSLDSEGFAVHSAIYRARPEVKCVWHSHHADCTAVSTLQSGLLPLSQESIRFMSGNLSYHLFEGMVFDMVERDRLMKSLGVKAKAMLMQNNGPLVLGESIEEAFELMYDLTRACSYQVKALAMVGGDISALTLPSTVQLEAMLDRFRRDTHPENFEEGHDPKELAFSAAQRLARLSTKSALRKNKMLADSAGPSEHEHKYSAAEWQMRCELAAAYRIAAHMMWDELIYTHITAKVPGSEALQGGPHILINPFGILFSEVTASSFLKVDCTGKLLDQGTTEGHLYKKGFLLHGALHRVRPDASIVWHSHHRDCAAVSALQCGLLPISQEALCFAEGNIAYHPFEGVIIDALERDRLSKSLGAKAKAMLLENNGPVVVADGVEESFYLMFNLTRACSYQVKALGMAGGDMSKLAQPLPTQLEAMLARMRQSPAHGKAERKPFALAFAAAKHLVEQKYGPNAIYV